MSGDTNIEWADKVWNPVTGCTKIGDGCLNCYAERMSKRLVGRCGYPADDPFKVTLHPKRLDEPLRWKKPQRIFVCSMSDLFHEDVPDEFIAAAFNKMRLAKNHIFLILTKRPERMKKWLNRVDEWGGWHTHDGRPPLGTVSGHCEATGIVVGGKTWPLSNVHLGVSVEDQKTADERIPLLLQTPASKRFVSYEPALGPVDFTKLIYRYKGLTCRVNALHAEVICLNTCSTMDSPAAKRSLDQIIMGGESGPRARPLHPDWARSVRDQCKDAGVPFFFKQWGEWQPKRESNVRYKEYAGQLIASTIISSTDKKRVGKVSYIAYPPVITEDRKVGPFERMRRVGKKAAGARLDDKEHREILG